MRDLAGARLTWTLLMYVGDIPVRTRRWYIGGPALVHNGTAIDPRLFLSSPGTGSFMESSGFIYWTSACLPVCDCLQDLVKGISVSEQFLQPIQTKIPANMSRWSNVGVMLGQRLRRWPNITPALDQRFVLADTPPRAKGQNLCE